MLHGTGEDQPMSKKTSFIRRFTALALALAVWAGAIWGLPPVSAAGLFSDVGAGHWAEKHVTKLALQGIVSGKGNGIFDPSGSIRREDAVLMVIRFLGLDDQIDTSETIFLPSALTVDGYAIHYVNEAIKKKLLYVEEEAALAENEKLGHWGQSPATREWVTRLLVRAIGKEAEAVENGGKATPFEDDASIAPEYKAYVVTAVANGLISGIQTTRNGVTVTRFEPKKPITRAEMATLISKAQGKVSVAYSGQVYGVLVAMEGDKIRLLHEDRSIREYLLSPDVLYARFDSDQPVSPASLQMYSQVMLLHKDDSTIGFVEQVDNRTHIRTEEGTFSKNDAASAQIWLSVGSGFKAYRYDGISEPYVVDATGKKLNLDEIPEGAPVTLTLDSQDWVLSVAVNQALVSKTASGTVVSWDAASGVLEVADPATGTTEKWTVAPNAVFRLENAPMEKEQLKVGASITYEVVNGSVVRVVMAKPPFETVEGIFQEVTSSRYIVYLADGKPVAKSLADSVTVTIEGMSNPGLADLQKNDSITLTVDANDKVTKIAVNNRKVEYLSSVTYLGYIEEIDQLTLKDTAGNYFNFHLGDNVLYDQNGTSISKQQALNNLRAGKKVTVAKSGNNLIAIYFIGKYSGTVEDNNLTAKRLTLRMDGGNTVTLPYVFPSVEFYGKDNMTYADVKPGDQVTVILNDNQDQIVSIQYRTTAQFEVTSINPFGMYIGLKAPDSSVVQSFQVPATAQLLDEKGNRITISQIPQGAYVNVTLIGRFNVEKLKLAPRAYGRVAAVNASAGTLDLSLPDGKVVTYTVGTSPIVTKGAGNIALSSLQPNDRVDLRTDANDRVTIRVIEGISKEVREYSGGKLRVYIVNMNDKKEYDLDASVYIHKGGNRLNASDLKSGDKVVIYELDGKVKEVEKL